MHAGAQDLVGFRDVGIGELRQAEFGLHAADVPIVMLLGVSSGRD
jgi:hypothetical protein